MENAKSELKEAYEPTFSGVSETALNRFQSESQALMTVARYDRKQSEKANPGAYLDIPQLFPSTSPLRPVDKSHGPQDLDNCKNPPKTQVENNNNDNLNPRASHKPGSDAFYIKRDEEGRYSR